MFEAVKDKSRVMYKIQGERGGVVPEELKGRYTKKQFADDAIRAYEAKKNAVQKGTSGRGRKAGSTARKEELQGS